MAEAPRARDDLAHLSGVLKQLRLELLERLLRLPEILGVDRFGDAAVGAPERSEQLGRAL